MGDDALTCGAKGIQEHANTPSQPVIAYVVLVVAFALAAHYAAPKTGGGASAFVVMWTPALAALAAGVLTRRSLGAIGWRPWPVKWLAAGWIIPSLYAFPAYGFVWLSGLGSVPKRLALDDHARDAQRHHPGVLQPHHRRQRTHRLVHRRVRCRTGAVHRGSCLVLLAPPADVGRITPWSRWRHRGVAMIAGGCARGVGEDRTEA